MALPADHMYERTKFRLEHTSSKKIIYVLWIDPWREGIAKMRSDYMCLCVYICNRAIGPPKGVENWPFGF